MKWVVTAVAAAVAGATAGAVADEKEEVGAVPPPRSVADLDIPARRFDLPCSCPQHCCI